MWVWEQMSVLGTWSKVMSPDPPMVKNGRIRTAEGQGPRVRNVSRVEDSKGEEPLPQREV